MLRKYIFLWICLSSCVPINTWAQLNNTFLEYKARAQDSLKNTLQFNLFSSSFFKNNEYFSDLNVGYTLFGSQGIAQVKYVAHPNISLAAGLYYRLDYGHEGFYTLSPYYRLQLSKQGYTINFGHIDGQINHRLLEPLFNPERFITDHLESGFQFKITRTHIWADTWINWERQQYPLSDYQEVLTGGHSSATTLWSDEQNRLSLPVQVLLHHRGGQIDTIDAPTFTTVNTATGLSFRHRPAGANSVLRSWTISSYYLYYHAAGAEQVYPFTDGFGVFNNLDVEIAQGWKLNLGHWYARHYLAPQGGNLFQSVSMNPLQPDLTEPERHLLFAGIAYQRNIVENLSVDVRLQPYWDFNHQRLEYAYALFFNFQPGFLLKRLQAGNSW